MPVTSASITLALRWPLRILRIGRGDIGRRKTRGRDLIEQRLKQVMIVAVDQRDVERLPGEALGDRQSAEAAADNDDPRLG